MDAIKGILAEYYWIFLIVGILVLITLIGFIASVKKKAKERERRRETKSCGRPSTERRTGRAVQKRHGKTACKH